jgi:hypothetical protein
MTERQYQRPFWSILLPVRALGALLDFASANNKACSVFVTAGFASADICLSSVCIRWQADTTETRIKYLNPNLLFV